MSTSGVHGGGGDVEAWIDGQLDPSDPEIDAQTIVNPLNSPPTGWGSPNDQQYQSGKTNNVTTNESAEQGMGVGPERKWPHFPHATNPNPFRNLNVLQRSGMDTYSTDIYRPEVVAFWAQALENNIGQAPVKQRSRVNPVVNQAQSVPFVETVPPVSPGGY
jgi:hypothetical protein